VSKNAGGDQLVLFIYVIEVLPKLTKMR